MSEIQIIRETLARTAKRHRVQRAWRGLWRGFLAGSAVWLLVLAIYKLLPVPEAVLSVAAVLALALPATGCLLGWLRRPTLAQTARWVDDRHHLEERLSTALEVAGEKSGTPAAAEWHSLVLADAARHAREFDPRRALPFHLPLVARWTALVLLLGATLGFVPEYRSKDHLQKKRQAEVIRDTGRQLAELTKRQLEHRKPALEPTQKAIENVQELGEKLSMGKLSRGDALKDLASATDKLKQDLRDLGQNPALRKLDQASKTPGGQTASSKAEMQKQMDALQKQLGQAGDPQKALEKMREELQKLQEAAAGMNANDPAAAQAQKEQLSKSLSQLSKQADQLGLSMPSLEDAIKALEGAQIDKFLKDLQSAELDLEKLQQMAQAMQQLQEQMAQLGKDLAEQLDKGQATAALATLQQMMQELKKAGLTPEQMEKMLAEVEKAVKPGSEYGKAGEFLQQAARDLKRGDKAGASQSMAKAAKEIQDMLEQMGDAQGMMASLAALQKAQLSIGNCQGWGQVKGPPKAGKGGKPGRGVGTWSEDDQEMSADQDDPWDNSGINRPDMAGKGLTDRGEGKVSDALTPTKVKGQLSPGGQMPSITLKGVSIKGVSKVQYQEAVATAQSEAQSAINQDQVPRAYQGAVRDYFDDLKE